MRYDCWKWKACLVVSSLSPVPKAIPVINWCLIIYLWMSKQTRLVYETHSLLPEEKGERQSKAITKQIKEWHRNKTSHAVTLECVEQLWSDYVTVLCVGKSLVLRRWLCEYLAAKIKCSGIQGTCPLTTSMHQVYLTKAEKFSPLCCPAIPISCLLQNYEGQWRGLCLCSSASYKLSWTWEGIEERSLQPGLKIETYV